MKAAGVRQGGADKFVRAVRADAGHAAAKRRAGFDGAENHRAGHVQRLIREAIAKTREAVTDGKTLAQPLAQSKLFPQLMVDLVRIGEDTGDVPGALNNLADTYETELQIALRVMSDLIGPVLIIVMAIVVGFLLLSIFLPLFKLISSIH
jgi:type IV pilus assembly protein PilC